jgi:hypothetical protein
MQTNIALRLLTLRVRNPFCSRLIACGRMREKKAREPCGSGQRYLEDESNE